MIDINALNFTFNNSDYLKIDHLKIKRNEKVVIIGSSGSFKTTFLKIISGLIVPSQGEVMIDGVSTRSSQPHLGYMFQNGSLFNFKTVYQNLELTLINSKKTKQEKKDLINYYLKLFNLEKTAQQYPNSLSGGQNQRVSLACNLINDLDLILFDEPFSKLDAILKEKLQKELLQIYNSRNLTTVLITHDIQEALLLGETIYIFKQDQIIKYENSLYNTSKPYENPKFYESVIELRKLMEL